MTVIPFRKQQQKTPHEVLSKLTMDMLDAGIIFAELDMKDAARCLLFAAEWTNKAAELVK